VCDLSYRKILSSFLCVIFTLKKRQPKNCVHRMLNKPLLSDLCNPLFHFYFHKDSSSRSLILLYGKTYYQLNLGQWAYSVQRMENVNRKPYRINQKERLDPKILGRFGERDHQPFTSNLKLMFYNMKWEKKLHVFKYNIWTVFTFQVLT
jgi:hypothetical protein